MSSRLPDALALLEARCFALQLGMHVAACCSRLQMDCDLHSLIAVNVIPADVSRDIMYQVRSGRIRCHLKPKARQGSPAGSLPLRYSCDGTARQQHRVCVDWPSRCCVASGTCICTKFSTEMYATHARTHVHTLIPTHACTHAHTGQADEHSDLAPVPVREAV
jgi:hypothetical protein